MTIFISHSSADKPFVRRLYAELRSRGLDAWLDEAEIRVGQSIPEEVGRALGNADIFCIVISCSSASSAWVSRELNAFAPKMIQQGGVILPCVIDESPLPAIIQDIKYADFSVSFKQGMRDLLNAVKVKEAFDKRVNTAAAFHRMVGTLSKPQLEFFVRTFERAKGVDESQITTEIMWDALQKLVILDVVFDWGMDTRLVTFELTSLGEEIVAAIAPSGFLRSDMLAALKSDAG
jgi:hypothetical protein